MIIQLGISPLLQSLSMVTDLNDAQTVLPKQPIRNKDYITSRRIVITLYLTIGAYSVHVLKLTNRW